jgi:hypothetical protein
MDENSLMVESFIWLGPGKSITLGSGSVRVWWNEGSFADASVIAPLVEWNVSDINGDIYFRKANGKITVGYS